MKRSELLERLRLNVVAELINRNQESLADTGADALQDGVSKETLESALIQYSSVYGMLVTTLEAETFGELLEIMASNGFTIGDAMCVLIFSAIDDEQHPDEFADQPEDSVWQRR